jgi:ABC-type transporter Mla MlaB component
MRQGSLSRFADRAGVLSAVKPLFVFSHLVTRLRVSETDQRTFLHLEGAATFLRLPLLASELEKVPAEAELHVDMDGLQYIDHACLDLLMNLARQHETTGGQLIIDWESLHGRFRRDRTADSKPR